MPTHQHQADLSNNFATAGQRCTYSIHHQRNGGSDEELLACCTGSGRTMQDPRSSAAAGQGQIPSAYL